ncbi:CHAT domain-containing protein [Delftia lacustris]|uniref:CHAT domain-containing protein n=1 Tax=Delftia lacustris TaxID=558537 RepID=UPI0035A5E1CB
MEETSGIKVHEIQGFNPAQLVGKDFGLGCIDLVQGGVFKGLLDRIVCGFLLFLKDEDGRGVFSGAHIILPPTSKYTVELVFLELFQAAKDLCGVDLSEAERAIVRRIIAISYASSLEVADLIAIVPERDDGIIVAIVDAGKYRDSSINVSGVYGASGVLLDEDKWAPHVASICRQLMPVVERLKCYGVVHAQEIPPVKAANIELLHSIDGCGVFSVEVDGGSEERANERASIWRSLVLQGRLQEVAVEIDSLGFSEVTRLHLLVQLLRGTGRDREVVELIEKLKPYFHELKSEIRVQLASIARKAGNDELALDVLPKNADELVDQAWLEEALDISTYFENNELISLFDKRLVTIFPSSERLRENRDRRLLMNLQRVGGGCSYVYTTEGFTSCHMMLQELLSVSNVEYDSIVAEAKQWGDDWKDLAIVCCALHAQSAGQPIIAANSASLVTQSELYGRQAALTVLLAMKQLFLQEIVPVDAGDIYRAYFQAVLRFLAQQPQDREIRLALNKLLAVESCGDMGIPIMATTMLDLAREGVQIARSDATIDKLDYPAPDEKFAASLERAIHWLGDLGAAEPGVTIIPRELLVVDPDDFVRGIERLVHFGVNRSGEDVDLEFMQQLVVIACAACPHAKKERDEDIRLMRMLACQFAVSDKFQMARDHAEQILLMGQTSAYRRRLAWQAFADVYHRCHNHIVALVALGCALAVNVEVEKADIWHEVYAIHRVLRDLGLFDLSRSFLPTMKELMVDLGFDADRDPRYLNAELGLRLLEDDRSDANSIAKLLNEVVDACDQAMGKRDHVVPLAVLLGQTIRKAENMGVLIPQQAVNVLQRALENAGKNVADLVKVVASSAPQPQDVLTLFNSLERAAYVEDIARDRTVIEMAARRLLNNKSSISEMVFAIELLADHTISLPGGVPAMTLEWPVQYASELNRLGLDVIFLALDNQGELLVVHASKGELHLVEQTQQSLNFGDRFREWRKKYPRGYGYVNPEHGNNLFYTTMEALGVSLPESDRLVVVAEPFLQQLTVNLVVAHPKDGGFEYFLGKEAAVGMIPSLTWLYSARSSISKSVGTYKAWISAEREDTFSDIYGEQGVADDGIERTPTLDIALSRLSGCFEDFGFNVNTGKQLPSDMTDAGLVVVTAHGGLDQDGRYLRSISDDGELFEAPVALANALAGIDLVILFVCSGGRIDKNPWDNSTTSLTKLLLNRGSRAVIASPWPLSVMVTYNWLGCFLQRWEEGASVLDATKAANDAVARRFENFPPYCLALRVYGDVLLTKPGLKNEV